MIAQTFSACELIPDSGLKELSFETLFIGRALACLVRSIFLGFSNLLPYLSVVYSNPSIAYSPIPGLVLVLAGTAISAVSEWQREQQEMLDPDNHCTTGIFRFSRYPESAAQILYHSGIVLTCYSQAPYTPLIIVSSFPHIFGILGIVLHIKRKDSFLQLTQVTNTRFVFLDLISS
ncbi:hypothetical protein LOD99_9176 [Oopsacas minuta]|uniref:Uncharacterized protein n=1 Tax=Oopsacas minuta TaxID=111878 RepID=A0AAV7JDL1_9METZ|nr:hypothetical protein LOD99_9176 [Oopsacas minuta]